LFLLFLDATAKGSKSKAVSKTGGGVVRQWDVLKLMVPEEEIPEFVDPMKWLAYFPPYGKEDLKRFGICTVRSYSPRR
jgi:leucyl-tRNA synthetase